jgi:hypothetical protein
MDAYLGQPFRANGGAAAYVETRKIIDYDDQAASRDSGS